MPSLLEPYPFPLRGWPRRRPNTPGPRIRGGPGPPLPRAGEPKGWKPLFQPYWNLRPLSLSLSLIFRAPFFSHQTCAIIGLGCFNRLLVPLFRGARAMFFGVPYLTIYFGASPCSLTSLQIHCISCKCLYLRPSCASWQYGDAQMQTELERAEVKSATDRKPATHITCPEGLEIYRCTCWDRLKMGRRQHPISLEPRASFCFANAGSTNLDTQCPFGHGPNLNGFPSSKCPNKKADPHTGHSCNECP